MSSTWMLAGSVLGGLGVALGAFGAHGLRDRVAPDLLRVWETGSHYHLVHALALLAVAWAASRDPASGWVQAAGWAFSAGILLFSGSLYLMAVTGVRALGAVTPLGGVAFLIGWFALAVAALRVAGN